MVLVLHQMFVCGILTLLRKLELRIKSRFDRHKTVNSVAVDCLASLSLYVNELSALRCLVERLMRIILPNLDDVLIFLLNPHSNELEILEQSKLDARYRTILPTEGVVRQCLEGKTSLHIKSNDISMHDPILALLQGSPEQLVGNQSVVLSPVYSSDHRIVAFLVLVSSQASEKHAQALSVAEKQILSCYSEIAKKLQAEFDYYRHKKFLKVFDNLCVPETELVSKKLVDLVVEETSAESGIVLILDQTSGELCNKYEVCDVLKERRIQVKDSVFEDSVTNRNLLNVYGISKGSKLRFDLVRITEFYVQSMLCVPLVWRNAGQSVDGVIALLCLFNKKDLNKPFSKHDEEIARFFCKHSAGIVENSLIWEREMLIKRQQQNLLKVARNLFNHADDVSILLNEIMAEARSLTNAERCSLFLLDRERNELVPKVFDGEDISSNNNHENFQENAEIRIPASQGVAGHVATTGKLLNIKNAYNHPLFYRGVDDMTGFKTRNILCFPIKDEKGVIGVAELCNKINGACFTTLDEDLTKGFAIYCGVSIFQSLLYSRAVDCQLRQRLANELMIYHMTVSQNEVESLNSREIDTPSKIDNAFTRFEFMPRTIPNEQTVSASLCMFQDLGFVERWMIPREILVRFVLMVKRGYRDPPYHNWTHAFTVAHFCYLLFKNSNVGEKLRDLEMFALFVACLCHDIDHRGTNNAFQVSSNSPLASLYSSEGSVLERHHFAQTMCILNTEGCNIFQNLSRQDYEEVLDLIRKVILATDLAHHFKILKNIQRMATDGFRVARADHHELLLFLMMTSSDLSDQTKPWEGTRNTSDLIYREFFSQGDMEKAEGLTPNEMMDRDRAYIPQLQVQFIDSVALPVYSLLHQLLPETEQVMEAVVSNRDRWKEVQERERTRIGTAF